MYIADGYPAPPQPPLFCFQKPAGARGLLVPDIDLLSHDYCLDVDGLFNDPIPFARKRPEAVFVGSTTGRRMTSVADVGNGTNERVAAALFFRDKDAVSFHLPNVVQCSAKVREEVEALGIAGRRWTWREQQDYRYMLSLDGNGATCSRVAAALHGHQLLAKYASANLLYYFHGLRPWRDFVPIVEHPDVLALLADADEAARWHGAIAAAGRRFATRFLTRLPIQRYTALLLSAYIARFVDGGRALEEPELPLLDCAIGSIGHPPRWGEPGIWSGADGLPITRATFYPYGLAAEQIICHAVGMNGAVSRPALGGESCDLGGEPFAELRLHLSGSAARRFTLAVQERFADGTVREAVPGNSPRPGPAPLTGFRIDFRSAADARHRLGGIFRRLTRSPS